MKFYSVITLPGTYKVRAVPFGINDDRGREVGANVEECLQRFIEKPPGSTGGFSSPLGAGTFFYSNVHMTRDGHRFGPGFHSRYALTRADIEKQIETRLAGMKSRMIKKFGG